MATTYNIYRPGAPATLVKAVKPTGQQQREAMGVDIVDMQFTLSEYVDFRINDYVTVYGRTYKLNLSPSVEKKGNRRFEYTLQFEAEFYDLAKVQLQFLNPDNDLLEPVFSLMGNAATIVGLIVENINRAYPGANWTVGVVDETDYQNFTYSAQNCLQALHDLASTFSTEFWIENKTIHLQRREQASELTFEYGKGNGLYNIKRQNKTNANIVTRLYVRGGSTNLPPNYGANSLLLPDGATYIQDNGKVALYGLIEATQIFPDIFPQRVGTITGVVAGAGNWKYFSDSEMDFDINAQLAPGLDAKVTFQTGQLAGYTFTISNYNAATKQFTINKNTDETAIDVPSDLLRPAVGDKYIIVDIIMPESYVIEAQNKLAAAGNAYYNQNSEPAFLLEYAATCDRLFIKQNAVDVQLGNTATLYDGDMGLNVELRIAKYTRDLQDENNYTEVVWSDTIGANEIVRQYQQQQKTLQLLESSGLLDINQLRKNLFLNRLSEQDGYLLLSGTKVKAGIADYAPEAGHSLLSDYAADSDKWDGNQFADYLNQPVKTDSDVRVKSLTSTEFVSGLAGSGFKVDEAGNATFDSLTVRKQFNVYELVVNKIRSTNGAIAVTDTGKIIECNYLFSNYYALKFDDGFTLSFDDVVRCQVFNGTSQKYYWGRIVDLEAGYYWLELNEGDTPAVGDELVRFGNSYDTDRQGLLYLTASDTNAPYLDVLDGVTSSNLTGKTKVRLGRLDGITDADFGALSGYGLYGENVYLKDGHFKGVVEVTGGNAETTAGAQSKADAAQSAAISTAAADATGKANAAQSNAIDAAASDATSKASAAQTAAILAAAADAQSRVDAVQVGGRNLIRNSIFANGIENVFPNKDVTISNIDGVLHVISNQNSSTPGFYMYFTTPLIPGQTYTLSLKIKSTVSILLAFSPSAPICQLNVSTEYSIVTTQIVPTNADTWVYVLFTTPDIGDYIDIDWVKFEKGNKATDWTPAPEDIDAGITNAQAAADAAAAANTALVASLRSLAYEDVVEVAKLGNTVIDGGKVKTTLLDVDWIQASVVTSTYINALALDATAIKSGTIDAARLNASQIVSDGGGATTGYVDTAVDNVQVGGRNYLKNSRFLSGFTGWNSNSGKEMLEIIPGGVRVTLTDTVNGGGIYNTVLTMPAGQTVFSAKVVNYGCSRVFLYNNVTLSSADLVGDSGIISLPFINDGSSLFLVLAQGDAGDYFEIEWTKAESGNKATDWTPAPEDVAADITSAQAAADAAAAANTALVASLKSLAYEDVVELGKLGTTIIDGGYIKSSLLDADYIKSNIINAAYIQALDIVATTVAATTGHIGVLEIGTNDLHMGDDSAWTAGTNYITLAESYFLYRVNGETAPNKREIAFDLYSNYGGSSDTITFRIENTTENTGIFAGQNIALYLKAANSTKSNGNVSLYIESGGIIWNAAAIQHINDAGVSTSDVQYVCRHNTTGKLYRRS
ncbi:hypothetical protein FW774_17350 [Pedobacter sp. BS3]|uniref:phage tail protein n=1 Tax=Pedobacter sp. BS3 TaxID=2567937 RepID=UPI0011EBD4ED|nr:phage tail protein [Pedobacter sp. BS3]TZF81822.1 hypothetical protein FW774_17350 [Pedobacter sp. BS3]